QNTVATSVCTSSIPRAAAALLRPKPPSLFVLYEPETTQHPELVRPVAKLLRAAAQRTQLVVVTHSAALLELLGDAAEGVELYKDRGETKVAGQTMLSTPPWDWGSR